jgi:glycosyltransferase involved in cell wall biosynthesis
MDLSNYIDNSIDEENISKFYKDNEDFNIFEYKKILDLSQISYKNLLNYYLENKNKNKNLIYSIKYFYNLYPLFDIYFYKKIYNNEFFKEDIEYLIDYHIKINNNEIIFYSLENFIEYYNIDINFLKEFYENLYDKSIIEIIIIINKDINLFILSIIDFNNKFPNFNIDIFKYIYNDLILENEIKYMSYWYNNKDNLSSNIEDIIKKYEFNIELYKFIYNLDFESDKKIILDWIKKEDKENFIYSSKTFMEIITDFNYNLFIKHFPSIKFLNLNEIINYYISNIEKINYIYSLKQFYLRFPKFDINKYKSINKIKINFEFNIINEFFQFNKIMINHIKNDLNFNLNIYNYFFDYDQGIIYENKYIIYSIETFYKEYENFNKDIYILFNSLENLSEEELILHFHNKGLKLNLPYNEFTIPNFSIKIYKELNIDLRKLDNKELVFHWYKIGQYENRIYSIDSFSKIYPNINFNDEDEIINWMKKGIYLENIKKNIIGREIVNNINEVLIDLSNPLSKIKLEKGISLIIRAKNEEKNIELCLNSVIDLVDEIIFVDNKSTDLTYNIVKSYSDKFNKIKLYQYNIDVNKVGIEHQNAIKNNNPNTLGTFYNWCLSKSTKNNIFKWDADFICLRNNFIQLVDIYNLKEREDKFAIWFTGCTLFENNNNYYINPSSFYNEYRIFSYKNNFSWYDGEVCEYTEPYLETCPINKKHRYEFPLFYELKRTSMDEFKERSSLIDNRDINDYNILNNLKDNKNNNLIKLDKSFINYPKKIIIYTPSLSFGGGNQFIINLYKILKYIGFIVYIFPNTIDNFSNKFNIIEKQDIKENLKINFIQSFNPDFILFNSDIPFNEIDLGYIKKLTKIIFITHSDVAYSNYFILKYNLLFYKIITVNNYTIDKLSFLLNIEKSKFSKLINYVNFNHTKISNKNLKFGIISRFSEDKNIPMFILSLLKIFKKYPNYQCYLVGCNNEYYDNYLKNLCKINNLDNNIIFTGFQENVDKYYKLFDFIVLPSVSEGCSYNIIESMNLGLPVVTSNVGGNFELIENKKNGIIYDYTGIKDFEKKTIYIKNYNEQLSCIGYIINNNDYNYQYNVNLLIPFYTKCKFNHVNLNNNCSLCKIIIQKNKLFEENCNKITDSLFKMIELNNDELITIENNNINFIKNNFNKEIYINQILNILTD